MVIDASVTLAWCFQDESSPYAAGVLEQVTQAGAVTAAIWPLEVANALLMAERRKCVKPAETARLVALLRRLPIEVQFIGSEGAFGNVLPLARHEQLTTYDAAYLELALRTGLKLATIDEPLKAAAGRLGVEFVQV